MKIFVTGGAGYIGSHTSVELLNAGHDVVIADNLSNSSLSVIERVGAVTGKVPVFYRADIRDKGALHEIFSSHSPDAVIHFAGVKAVSESISQPLSYYSNNVGATLALCEVMAEHGVFKLVFSSSASVYGNPAVVPVREDFPRLPTNPYGRSKLMAEEILSDLHIGDRRWNVVLLRYFNPVGAHESGKIGEDPNGIPANLVPYIGRVAMGYLPELSVFGGDYPTADGTGVRDYIHVVDLALGHISALHELARNAGVTAYNLGTGRGYSVLEMIAAYSEACGKEIPYKVVARRPGDIPESYAEVSLAESALGWRAQRGIAEMCKDEWRWQLMSSRLRDMK